MTRPLEAGQRIRVTVPATSANLGPGFDSLGLALARSDELELETIAGGALEVGIEGEGRGEVPLDERHLVVRALDRALAELGARRAGLRLRARNAIPHGRGMGSSGAAIVAGVVAANALAGAGASDDELLRIATAIEGHPDNVAPCLRGGLTIAWMSDGSGSGAAGDVVPRATKLQVHRGIAPLVLVPSATMSTRAARALQPQHVPHADAAFNVSRSALLIAALTQSPEFLVDATEDRLHQSYRASAMPETASLIARLRERGHAAVVSGAGPSVLVLAASSAARLAAADFARGEPGGWTAILAAVDVLGATVETASVQTASSSTP